MACCLAVYSVFATYIQPQVPGDGRELVATVADAVKVRSEDGRAVRGVDISTFIDGLPLGRSTSCFSTDDASGSTSQARVEPS